MSKTRLLLGDEALAQGALDAGLSGCYAYPGTPSTEILEYIQAAPERRTRGLHADWSANEKTAMEEALGMSYAGKRAMVCMKHVGLNVAADGFINAAITGTNGGLVVVVADDPSMHSSQNEQDSRFYAKFALVPCLEPSSQQEAYDMARQALAVSEELQLPVMIRITTRLAHSRASVRLAEPQAENALHLPAEPRRFVLLPANARRNYAALVQKQTILQARSDCSPYNVYTDGPDRSLGIVAAGIGLNYLLEHFPHDKCPHPVLKVSQYPWPRELLRRLLAECEQVLVLEDGAPFIEEALHGPLGLSDRIRGRLTGHLPRTGELSPEVVTRALKPGSHPAHVPHELVRPRPPRLCAGCPHIDSYKALQEVLRGVGDGHVFSDIGCYTLGALPPFEAINSCVDMGASISMAKGAADAGLAPAVAVIGDSTFTHSGMTPLLDAVWEQTRMTVIILDNGTTGMTGGQVSMATGRLDQIVAGLGVEPAHLRVIVPLAKNHAENVRVLREEIFNGPGVSVVIARRECIQALRHATRSPG